MMLIFLINVDIVFKKCQKIILIVIALFFSSVVFSITPDEILLSLIDNSSLNGPVDSFDLNELPQIPLQLTNDDNYKMIVWEDIEQYIQSSQYSRVLKINLTNKIEKIIALQKQYESLIFTAQDYVQPEMQKLLYPNLSELQQLKESDLEKIEQQLVIQNSQQGFATLKALFNKNKPILQLAGKQQSDQTVKLCKTALKNVQKNPSEENFSKLSHHLDSLQQQCNNQKQTIARVIKQSLSTLVSSKDLRKQEEALKLLQKIDDGFFSVEQSREREQLKIEIEKKLTDQLQRAGLTNLKMEIAQFNSDAGFENYRPVTDYVDLENQLIILEDKLKPFEDTKYAKIIAPEKIALTKSRNLLSNLIFDATRILTSIASQDIVNPLIYCSAILPIVQGLPIANIDTEKKNLEKQLNQMNAPNKTIRSSLSVLINTLTNPIVYDLRFNTSMNFFDYSEKLRSRYPKVGATTLKQLIALHSTVQMKSIEPYTIDDFDETKICTEPNIERKTKMMLLSHIRDLENAPTIYKQIDDYIESLEKDAEKILSMPKKF